VRAAVDAQADEHGWPAVHARLQIIDPIAARRINPNDSQRLQRAMEVFEISGRPLTEWQTETSASDTRFVKLALRMPEREVLHQRIAQRLDLMFASGFVAEVAGLMRRSGLTENTPSMRSVGYRQVWQHLAGHTSLEEARYRSLVATRQLAKRQITWLRSESELFSFSPLEAGCIDTISKHLDTMPHLFDQ
jgi:tRNA dimethylallyltransferase